MNHDGSQINPVRWGIIGCGDVTEVKSGPAFKLTPGFELAAVMRRDASKARDYALRHDVDKYTSDAGELIHDPGIDALYIATPPDSHAYYALQVAQAGKICCIEKPMAPTYRECLEINKAFEEKDIPLFVSYYRRSLEAFTDIRSWIDTGRIGKVRHASIHLSKPPNDKDRSGVYNWRTDARIAPGGYFDDLASHELDLITYLLGPIKDVSGHSTNQQNLYPAKDAFTASWIHESGVTGCGSWNFGCGDHLDRVEVFGDEGQIKFSVFQQNPIVLETGSKTQKIPVRHPHHIQLPHVRNLNRHLTEAGYTHPSTGTTALHTAYIMDKILNG